MSASFRDWIRNAEIIFETLTPAELEAASGLSSKTQRLWRSRGHLAKEKGQRATYELLEAAMLQIAAPLSAHGMNVAEAMGIGRKYRHRLLQLALFEVDGLVEVTGVRDDVDGFCHAASQSWPEFCKYISQSDHSDDLNILIILKDNEIIESEKLPEVDKLGEFYFGRFINLVGAARRLGVEIERVLVRIKISEENKNQSPIVRRRLSAGKY